MTHEERGLALLEATRVMKDWCEFGANAERIIQTELELLKYDAALLRDGINLVQLGELIAHANHGALVRLEAHREKLAGGFRGREHGRE